MDAPLLERTTADRKRVARAEAVRFWTPVTLVIIGAGGILAGFLLGGVCARFVVDMYGQVSCVPLLDDASGAAIVIGSGILLAAGVYLIFFNKPQSFEHTCAECGKAYRDGSPESVYRARGHMACSAECAERIEGRARMAELQDKVAVLATMAVQAAQGVERTRARERLQEIAAYATEPVRTQALEALRRLDGG